LLPLPSSLCLRKKRWRQCAVIFFWGGCYREKGDGDYRRLLMWSVSQRRRRRR
jgi:hypothetical protein